MSRIYLDTMVIHRHNERTYYKPNNEPNTSGSQVASDFAQLA